MATVMYNIYTQSPMHAPSANITITIDRGFNQCMLSHAWIHAGWLSEASSGIVNKE